MTQTIRNKPADAAVRNQRIRLSGPGATTSGATLIVSDSDLKAVASARPQEQVERAVYAHIQAMRALGHSKANTAEIARALGLPQAVVDRTIAALTKKGVRVS